MKLFSIFALIAITLYVLGSCNKMPMRYAYFFAIVAFIILCFKKVNEPKKQ